MRLFPPLSPLMYWDTAALVTPKRFATCTWVIPWLWTSSLASAPLAVGRMWVTISSQGIFMSRGLDYMS